MSRVEGDLEKAIGGVNVRTQEVDSVYQKASTKFQKSINPIIEHLRGKITPKIIVARVTDPWISAEDVRPELELDLESGRIFYVSRQYHFIDEDSEGNYLGVGTFQEPVEHCRRDASPRIIINHMGQIIDNLKQAIAVEKHGKAFSNNPGEATPIS